MQVTFVHTVVRRMLLARKPLILDHSDTDRPLSRQVLLPSHSQFVRPCLTWAWNLNCALTKPNPILLHFLFPFLRTIKSVLAEIPRSPGMEQPCSQGSETSCSLGKAPGFVCITASGQTQSLYVPNLSCDHWCPCSLCPRAHTRVGRADKIPRIPKAACVRKEQM